MVSYCSDSKWAEPLWFTQMYTVNPLENQTRPSSYVDERLEHFYVCLGAGKDLFTSFDIPEVFAVSYWGPPIPVALYKQEILRSFSKYLGNN